MLIKCPTCRKEIPYKEDNPFRPFCSERCQLIDLGAWAQEKFAVPAEDQSPSPTIIEVKKSEESE